MLALVGGAAYAALHTSTRSVTVAYVDPNGVPNGVPNGDPYGVPNGVPAPYTEIASERPYATAAIAAGAGIMLAAALEAAWFAKRGPAQLVIASDAKGAGVIFRF